MYTIHLNNLRFFAHHGMHDEEAITGTDFEVTVAIGFEAKEKITSLAQTINYVEVYEAVKILFHRPVKLIEGLAEDICAEIYALDPVLIKTIQISIHKLNPPIMNFSGTVGVTLSKQY